jgi:hypothetical protein
VFLNLGNFLLVCILAYKVISEVPTAVAVVITTFYPEDGSSWFIRSIL